MRTSSGESRVEDTKTSWFTVGDPRRRVSEYQKFPIEIPQEEDLEFTGEGQTQGLR